MNTFIRFAAPLLAACVFASVAVVGCSSDDSSGGNGDPTVVDTGVRDTDVPSTDGGTDTGSTPDDTGTTPTDGGADAPWSLDSGTCFPGKPTTMVEYLNKCTTADKVKFTKKLTKLNADGSRPALP